MENVKKKNIQSFLVEISQKYGAKPALWGRSVSAQGDFWRSLSFQDICEQSEKVARKLLSLGLQKNDKVLILSKSAPEFSVAFFSTPLAGGIIVPLDIRLSLNDQKFIADFSEAKFLFCLREDYTMLAEKLSETTERALQVLIIEDLMAENTLSEEAFLLQPLSADEIFLMSFTSGTTSHPKAVMLTFDNIFYQIEIVTHLMCAKSETRMLSMLPLHHMFELMAGFLVPLYHGGSVYYGNSLIPQQIISFFRQHKITNILVVPLILRALKKGIEGEVRSSVLKRVWFYSSLQLAKWIPSQRFRSFLFQPLHKKLGGELRQIVSGASALDLHVGDFFDRIGISVFEGYGMTETAPVISCSSPGHKKPGSVGKPLPGLEVKLHPVSQEILVRGRNVMKGYYKNSEATLACLSADGWFNTGDVGQFDEEGFLSIRGRNKDIIVLGSGKKVAPEEIEEYLRGIPDIQEVCVIGMKSSQGATKGTEVITAVIVNGKDVSQEEMQKKLQIASLQMSYYKRPTRFVFLNEPLPKTTTLKIKKNLVRELLIAQRITV